MDPSTNVTISEIEEFVRAALEEEGVDYNAVKATTYTDQSFNDRLNISVRKRINGKVENFMIELSIPLSDDISRVHAEVAQAARKIAETICDELVTEVSISGTLIKFCPYNGGWIECKRCGENLGLHELTRGGMTALNDAELTNPSPAPYEIQGFLQRLDDENRQILKLYMLGALRNHCRCSFGKRDMYAYR